MYVTLLRISFSVSTFEAFIISCMKGFVLRIDFHRECCSANKIESIAGFRHVLSCFAVYVLIAFLSVQHCIVSFMLLH